MFTRFHEDTIIMNTQTYEFPTVVVQIQFIVNNSSTIFLRVLIALNGIYEITFEISYYLAPLYYNVYTLSYNLIKL